MRSNCYGFHGYIGSEGKRNKPFKNTIKKLAAKLTKEEWNIDCLQSIPEINNLLSQRPLVDMSCYDITLDEALDKLIEFRRNYEETGLKLITYASISPVKYLRPGIKSDSMLMRPLRTENIYETMKEFIASYFQREYDENNQKSYIIENKDGKIILPYQEIFI